MPRRRPPHTQRGGPSSSWRGDPSGSARASGRVSEDYVSRPLCLGGRHGGKQRCPAGASQQLVGLAANMRGRTYPHGGRQLGVAGCRCHRGRLHGQPRAGEVRDRRLAPRAGLGTVVGMGSGPLWDGPHPVHTAQNPAHPQRLSDCVVEPSRGGGRAGLGVVALRGELKIGQPSQWTLSPRPLAVWRAAVAASTESKTASRSISPTR
jgi:hypothetical protein